MGWSTPASSQIAGRSPNAWVYQCAAWREHGLLLGFEVGAQAVEVAGDRRPPFRVDLPEPGDERFPHAAAVDRVVRRG